MFKSINPYTSLPIKNYSLTSEKETNKVLIQGKQAFLSWKNKTIESRALQIKQIGILLNNQLEVAAKLISLEVGKPITQSKSEIEKCIKICDFYAEKASSYLKEKQGETDFESYVSYEPLGVILGIMPWNYPFWQVFRFAIPTLLAGNSVILKHAANVGGCALLIENIFNETITIQNVYQNLFLENNATENLISNPIIKGVSLTGSTKAGRDVASVAGKHLKPIVLELGGSNALIVCKDADLDKTVEACVLGRFQNNGQSCIAVKRVLVDTSIEKEFIEKLLVGIKKLKTGNPLDSKTKISVLAKSKFVKPLSEILEDSLNKGAQLICGGKHKGAYFEPTLVTKVTSEMSLFQKETFGPILPITLFSSIEEAINLANATNYGLGVSVFTENKEVIKEIIPKFDDGAVFINSIVKSIAALPFGGAKTSGLGRELSEEGIKAFVNVKTVVIK